MESGTFPNDAHTPPTALRRHPDYDAFGTFVSRL